MKWWMIHPVMPLSPGVRVIEASLCGILQILQGISSRALTWENMNPSSLRAMNSELLDQLECSLTFLGGMCFKMLIELGYKRIVHWSWMNLQVVPTVLLYLTQLNVDVGPKASDIDMNSEPNANTTLEVAEPEDKTAVAGIATNVPSRINDVFWEQFLTENPGSVDASEVQSEKKDIDSKNNESKTVDSGKYWWNMRSVNSLAEQMGHLTPAEKT